MLRRSQSQSLMADAAALLLTAVLLLADSAVAQDINVTVDDVSVSVTDSGAVTVGERYTLGKLKHLALTCRASSLMPLSVGDFAWRMESSNSSPTVDPRITVATQLTNSYSGSSVLNINYPIKSDVTGYVCVVNQTVSGTGRFQSVPLLTLKVNGVNEYDSSVWPGDSLTVVCLVDGYPMGDIRWSKSVDPTFNVTNNGTIYLSSVRYDVDRGYITCTSKNKVGENTAKLFLRVKSPMSYLAPLVAIFCEVLTMLLIVVAYEIYDKKRRRVRDGDDPKSE